MFNQENLGARFKSMTRLGKGGFGEVFKAKDLKLDSIVAIKQIVSRLGEDPKIFDMLRDEAILTRQLDHPNIVKIYDIIDNPGEFALIMQYLNGLDLGKLIKRLREVDRTVPLKVALYIIGEVCKALDYAHNAKHQTTAAPLKIVHRDVSPSNIMLTYEGDVKVIDFGIAKAEFATRSTHSSTGVLKGKVSYFAPEHGGVMDGRSDVFPLGAVLYETLTGEKLFDNQNTLELMDQVKNATIPIHKFQNDLIPLEIRPIIKKAVAKDLDKRYRSALEMYEAIEDFLLRRGAKPSELKRELCELAEKFADHSNGEDNEAEVTPTKDIVASPSSQVAPTLISTMPSGTMDFDRTLAGLEKAVEIPPQKGQEKHPPAQQSVFSRVMEKAHGLKLSTRTLQIGLGALLVTVLAVAAFVLSQNPLPRLTINLASNVDSMTVLVNDQPQPASFQWPSNLPFHLTLYCAGFDTLTGFHYLGELKQPELFEIKDHGVWQYEARDSVAAVTGKFFKMIQFKTTPVSSTVIVNDDSLFAGSTDEAVRLFAGPNRITLRPNVPGYAEESFELFIDADSPGTVSKTFYRPLKISVYDAVTNKPLPGAREYLGGEFRPLSKPIALAPKSYTAKILAPGYLDQNVRISAQEVGEKSVALRPQPQDGVKIEIKDMKTGLPVIRGKIWYCKDDKLKDCDKDNKWRLFGELNSYGSYTGKLEAKKEYLFKVECPGYVFLTIQSSKRIPDSGRGLLHSFSLTPQKK